MGWFGRQVSRILEPFRLDRAFRCIWVAKRGAQVFKRRHRQVGFDLIQSADLYALGLWIGRPSKGRHLIRCSAAWELYHKIDGQYGFAIGSLEVINRWAMKRAHAVYAPSRFTAEYYKIHHHIPVQVIYPPSFLERKEAGRLPMGIPDRYLLYFGQLMDRKGLHWLIEALMIALTTEPEIKMVMLGAGNPVEVSGALAQLGAFRSNVLALYPLPKADTYSVLTRAEATVLPSLVDNLPNTVIESLMVGVPVIGTRGASIDELIREGVNGELVEPGDREGLAKQMVEFWRGQNRVKKGGDSVKNLLEEMEPAIAIARLLAMASDGR